MAVLYEASDWLVWSCLSCNTATNRLGVILTALDIVYMRININVNKKINAAV